MSEILDYIIYMTYDLHGQWDAGNKWSSPGCPTGNCLRHHVNETEVNLSLSMVTKAGVPSNKIVVGMPLYGRSFKMAEKGCAGPGCLFTGDRLNSQAAKGVCTDTAGYISNVEIRGVQGSNSNPDLYGSRAIEEFYDEGDIIVYDDTEWVSWLKPANYLLRAARYLGGNFGGTSDWAIDLDADFGKGGDGDQQEPLTGADEPACDYSRTFKDLDVLKDSAGGLSLFCRQIYALNTLEKMLDDLYEEYKRVDNGYDTKFEAYTRYIDRITPYGIKNYMSEGMECRFSFPLGLPLSFHVVLLHVVVQVDCDVTLANVGHECSFRLLQRPCARALRNATLPRLQRRGAKPGLIRHDADAAGPRGLLHGPAQEDGHHRGVGELQRTRARHRVL